MRTMQSCYIEKMKEQVYYSIFQSLSLPILASPPIWTSRLKTKKLPTSLKERTKKFPPSTPCLFKFNLVPVSRGLLLTQL